MSRAEQTWVPVEPNSPMLRCTRNKPLQHGLSKLLVTVLCLQNVDQRVCLAVIPPSLPQHLQRRSAGAGSSRMGQRTGLLREAEVHSDGASATLLWPGLCLMSLLLGSDAAPFGVCPLLSSVVCAASIRSCFPELLVPLSAVTPSSTLPPLRSEPFLWDCSRNASWKRGRHFPIQS